MDNTPLRVGFIGAGAMAQAHLGALRRVTASHTVVGVHDLNPAQGQQVAAQAGCRFYPDLAGLLGEGAPHVVHVCTPAGTHFEPARQALSSGAHVYVEKPFVETQDEAEILLRLAQERGRLVCAGHQLMRDRAFVRLLSRAADLCPAVLVDSYFAFRPLQLVLHRAAPRQLAQQLLDILPHPLYTLLAALDGVTPDPPALVAAFASSTELHALLRAGNVSARLCVSLTARPVASTLTITGANGTLSADFVRSIMLGAGNEGTGPLEKIVNPVVEGGQLMVRSTASLGRRLLGGGGYAGLPELLGEFYEAAAGRGHPPLSAGHLTRATALYEELAEHVWRAVRATPRNDPSSPSARRSIGQPTAVVTGASGFVGREVTRELAARGFHVRGIGRARQSSDPHVHEWVQADLGRACPPDAFASAQVVVHAAAETSGGFEAHQRNTIDATRNVLGAMEAAGVRRLVFVSSISVLRPPHTPWERQDERTPLPERAEQFGAYTWGKCVAEQLVSEAHAGRRIEARIVRPAAVIDWDHIEMPGLVGRRLFGRWHLGFGRPSLPFAIVDVRRTGAVLAWCAERFNEAPQVMNLIDPAIKTRRELLVAFRTNGWLGRMVWAPIPLLATLFGTARWALALLRLQTPRRLAVWGVLRPRRYDAALAATVLRAVDRVELPRREPVASLS